MEIFEHKTVSIRQDEKDVDRVLTEYGGLGWEPYAVTDKSQTNPGAPLVVYLKRRRAAASVYQSGLTGYIES